MQAMVFGKAGASSGSGVGFTRNPTDGRRRAVRRLPVQCARRRCRLGPAAFARRGAPCETSCRTCKQELARAKAALERSSATCRISSSRWKTDELLFSPKPHGQAHTMGRPADCRRPRSVAADRSRGSAQPPRTLRSRRALTHAAGRGCTFKRRRIGRAGRHWCRHGVIALDCDAARAFAATRPVHPGSSGSDYRRSGRCVRRDRDSDRAWRPHVPRRGRRAPAGESVPCRLFVARHR